MEKKNTILLTVIAVATLLVAVVGATFAYFTATSSETGSGGTASVQTATASSVSLTAAEVSGTLNTVYPGTKNFAGMSVTASSDASGTDNDDYTITYTVNGSVTLGSAFTEGDVTYTLYRTTTSVNNPVTCSAVTETAGVDGVQYSQTCTLAEALGDGQIVLSGSGTITSGNTSATITVTGETLNTSDNTTAYYYLVVEYPDTNEDQSNDMNKSITAVLANVTITNTEVMQ